MTKPITDQAQRQQAIDQDESFIVRAPAGSGKTELLIQRYLHLLGFIDVPEEIICITFTRKAAAEMHGRIMQALEQATTSVIPDEEHKKQTRKLALQALLQDKKLTWELLENPSRLKIQTIDSLCNYLTRRMPILSKFGAQPETLEDATALYQKAAANTLAELESNGRWSDDIARLLEHLDNDLPRIRDLIATMLSHRDHWLRHVAGKVRRDDLEGALLNVVTTSLTHMRICFPETLKAELLELLEFAVQNLERADTNSLIRHCKALTDLPENSANSLQQWQGIVTFLLKKDGTWRRQAKFDIGFPAASENKLEAEQRKTMKARYTALLAKLSDNDTLHQSLLEVQILPPVCYTENEWQILDALCQLLILADAQLRLLFAERNQTDFIGINQAAIEALGSMDSPSDLVLHLDHQIRHLLIDEFQDTSINQYILLQRLTSGWSKEDGHTLFLVGDPMQSIYRFREAEVGIFLNTWQQQRLGQIPLVPLTLKINFRSQLPVVQWVNDIFSQVLPVNIDVGRGAVSYSVAEAFYQQSAGSNVQLHPTFNHDHVREADTVIKLIKKTKEDNPNDTIAILVRNRLHLAQIIPLMQQEGLQFRAVEIEALGQRPVIQDLLALTRAILHFGDRIAWLAILRAPWCGLTLADLLQLTGSYQGETVWECIHDETKLQSIPQSSQQRLIKLRTILQETFLHCRRRPLRRELESVWLRLGGPACLTNESDLENVQTFFQLVEEYSSGSDLKDITRFLENVEGLFAAPNLTANEDLQIMTIHKAKGLEFDTVLIPGLGRGTKADTPRLLMWLEKPREKLGEDLLLAPIKEAGQDEAPIYQYVKYLEKEKQRYEDARLLYVAATRAKRNLHLLGSVGVISDNQGLSPRLPQVNSLLAQIWPMVRTHFKKALQFSDEIVDKPFTPDPIRARGHQLQRLAIDWNLPDPPPRIQWTSSNKDDLSINDDTNVEFEWAGETIMHVGTVVHRCIQYMAQQGTECWNEDYIKSRRPYIELALKRLNVPDDEIIEAVSRAQKALLKFMNDKRGQWILNDTHQSARNEYAVSGVHKNKLINVIIDRTFIDTQGTRWIIDYKIGHHEGSDIEQFLDREQERYRGKLEIYAELLSYTGDNPIKLGLYYPLLEGWREWDYV